LLQQISSGMACPPGDRRVSGCTKTRQPRARRRHAAAALCHGEEALYPPDWAACCPLCSRVALFFVQYCLLLRPHGEPLFCGPPALPPAARLGRETLPVLLARRA